MFKIVHSVQTSWRISALVLLPLAVSGCQGHFLKDSEPQIEAPSDEIVVQRQITESARRIDEKLRRLAEMGYARSPVHEKSRSALSSDPVSRPVSFHWDGPVEQGVEALGKLHPNNLDTHLVAG